jgi:release factor glutamine methyltransferase
VVGVTLAAERSKLRVICVDSEEGAVELTRKNARANDVADRVKVTCGHLLEPVEEQMSAEGAGVDVVASNPPYVPTDDIEELEPEVKDHEPRRALDGGPDGLDVIRELVPAAGRVLKPGGWLAMEIGEGQSEDVRDILEGTPDFRAGSVLVREDGAGHERVIASQKKEED